MPIWSTSTLLRTPRDDNDYLKRYWFLEGLSDYWQGGTAWS